MRGYLINDITDGLIPLDLVLENNHSGMIMVQLPEQKLTIAVPIKMIREVLDDDNERKDT